MKIVRNIILLWLCSCTATTLWAQNKYGSNLTFSINKGLNFTNTSDPPLNISTNEQDISITPFKRTNQITENGYSLTYKYGPDYTRVRGSLTTGSNTETRMYDDDYEEMTNASGAVTKIHYLHGLDGICGIVVNNGSGNQYYFVYKDHLGSLLTLTDDKGVVQYEQNFDAWGRKRNPINWTYTTSSVHVPPSWLYRGFTGHEHLDKFNLINMNARLYDPVLARMCAADNEVQDATSTQAYNRYTYAANNPLTCTDPTGNDAVVDDIAVATIGALIGYITYGSNTGQWLSWKALAAAGMGAAMAELSYVSMGGAGAYGVDAGSGITSGTVKFLFSYASTQADMMLQNGSAIAADKNKNGGWGGVIDEALFEYAGGMNVGLQGVNSNANWKDLDDIDKLGNPTPDGSIITKWAATASGNVFQNTMITAVTGGATPNTLIKNAAIGFISSFAGAVAGDAAEKYGGNDNIPWGRKDIKYAASCNIYQLDRYYVDFIVGKEINNISSQITSDVLNQIGLDVFYKNQNFVKGYWDNNNWWENILQQSLYSFGDANQGYLYDSNN